MGSRAASAGDIVREHGGVLSGAALRKYLRSQYSLKADNARQIIYRARVKGILHRYDLGNDSLYTRAQQPIPSLPDVKPVLAALREAHPGLEQVCSTLVECQAISVGEALKISAARAPSEVDPSQHENIKYLLDLDLAQLVQQHHLLLAKPPLVKTRPEASTILPALNRLRLQRILLKDLMDMLQRVNAIAWKRWRSDPSPALAVQDNGTFWDATAVSYARGIRRRKGTRRPPRLVLAEAVYGRKFTLADQEGFERRLAHVYHRTSESEEPVAIVLAHWLQGDIFEELKRRGYLIYTLEQLFGERALKEISKLRELLTDREAPDPIKISEVLQGLHDLDRLGEMGNLRGLLFEYLVADWLRKTGLNIEQQVSLHKQKDDVERDMEIDIFGTTESKLLIVECRGHGATTLVQKSELVEFFDNKFRPAARALRYRAPNRREVPLFVTSSSLDEDAEKYIEQWITKHQAKFKDDTVIITREELLTKLKEVNRTSYESVRKFYC